MKCLDCGIDTKKSIRCKSCSHIFNNKNKVHPNKGKTRLSFLIEKYGEDEGNKLWKVEHENLSQIAKERNRNPDYINPFSGKSAEILILEKYGEEEGKKLFEDYKKKLSIKSKENWKDDNYRNDVITKVSKPRRIQFKEEQSERITQWYVDNPNQKELRSKHMKNSWNEGKITPNETTYNHSKAEDELRDILKKRLLYDNVIKKTIKLDNSWFYPDIIINDKIIIEYLGDYWHMNPLKFEWNFIHPRTKKLAKDVWEYDNNRKQIFEKYGYIVIFVWEYDYKIKKDDIINNICKIVNDISNENFFEF